MQIYCISDNIDTKIGMRIVGIDGEVVHELDELNKSLDRAFNNSNIGIVLITEKLVNLASERIKFLKLNRRTPLIVEIPDRHLDHKISDNISQYVREAVGIKI